MKVACWNFYNEPRHEIMALFALRKLILQTRIRASSGARCLIFGRTLRLLPYFMCANSEGSGETARMRRLACAFAGRLCDKFNNLMSWLYLSSISMCTGKVVQPIQIRFTIKG